MTDDDMDPDGETVLGHVKWFDPGKGFGFVVATDGGPDILLHANVLRNFGQSSVADGSPVELVVQETPRGKQATRIVTLSRPESTGPSGLSDLEGRDPEELAAQPLLAARVKWFDKGKGFGFANAFGEGDDIFIHIEVLRKSALADLQPGEAIALRVIEGRRGKMAMEVLAWDAALEEEGEV